MTHNIQCHIIWYVMYKFVYCICITNVQKEIPSAKNACFAHIVVLCRRCFLRLLVRGGESDGRNVFVCLYVWDHWFVDVYLLIVCVTYSCQFSSYVINSASPMPFGWILTSQKALEVIWSKAVLIRKPWNKRILWVIGWTQDLIDLNYWCRQGCAG